MSAGAQHGSGIQGAADYRGLTAMLLLAACNIVIALLWSAAGHWTLSDAYWPGVYLMVASIGLPLLVPRYRTDPKTVTALATTTAIIIFTRSAGLLGYLLASTDAPLVDAVLARWDSALGFDWVGQGRWLALPFVLLNALVLLSTPRFGGHYLVDMMGGVAVFGVAV